MIRTLAIALAFAAALTACRQEEVVTATAEPSPTAAVAEASPAADIQPLPPTEPYIEPVPPPEIPSIMRRDQAAAGVPTVVTPDFPRRITPDELKAMLDQGTAVVIDVRSEEYFRQRHIPGSLNIPVQEVVLRANEIPEGKTAVAVCT
jgi:hypothetical protein